MDIFIKIIGVLFGLGFIFLGIQFFFRGKHIIQWIQKQKYHQTAEPRIVEVRIARVIGILLFLIGVYYAGIAILSLI